MKELKITLAAARVNAGLTQDDVAAKLKVSNKTVGNWENGTTKPTQATLFALSALYEIPEENIYLPLEST